MRRLCDKLGIALLTVFVGCTSQQAQQSIDRENSRLRWLVRLYTHVGQQGHLPKSEQEFKDNIQGIDPALRDRAFAGAGVNSAEELFVSERDGLPFVVLYGAPRPGVASGLIAFEQQGRGGRRYVAYTAGMIEEVDGQQFDMLVPEAVRGN